MVGFYGAYHGSEHTPLIYVGGKLVRKVYKGSDLVYQIGFDPITFTQNGTFTVPYGITKIHIDAVGSKGYGASGVAGKGGRVQCDLEVVPHQVLNITVGSIPTVLNEAVYNASDIRVGGTDLSNRIIVAGGGGSGTGLSPSSSSSTHYGGAGGGLTGGTAGWTNYMAGGFGGTQSGGGSASYRTGGNVDGWVGGANGTLGMGGNGGYGYMYGGLVRGGAGGAGYYGGGGGSVYDIDAVGISFAGGGGGSSYTNSNCSNVVHTQGFQDGAGYVTITMAV